MRKEFKDFIIEENFRIAHEYRLLLYKELINSKIIFAKSFDHALPFILDCLKLVELPKYNKYQGKLDIDIKAEIFSKIPKVNKEQILNQFIKDNF